MSLFPYTDSNHFQFGYRNRRTPKTRWLEKRSTVLSAATENNAEEFVARYGRAQSRLPSWREANELAASRIFDLSAREGLTPVVCYSGGVDSEVALLSFLNVMQRRADRPRLDVATLEFSDGSNRHDTEYVEKFKNRFSPDGLDIQFSTYTLNPVEFLSSPEFLALSDETGVLSPPALCQLWLCDQIFRRNSNALPIIGQGELHLVRPEDPSGQYRPAMWSIVETENLCGLYQFFIGRGRPAVPGFFQYLPEQFEAQLRLNPVLHELISNSRIGKLGTRTSKPEIIAFDYPELERRPKYTGFEKLESLHDEYRAMLAKRNPLCEAKWKQNVFDLMADLKPAPPGPVTVGDWKFAWGHDGRVNSSRTSQDDFFATEWSPPSLLTDSTRLAGSKAARATNSVAREKARAGFIAVCRALVSPQTTLLHTGSPLARVFACLMKDAGATEFLLSENVVPPSPIEVSTWGLLHDLHDAESLAYFAMCRSLASSLAIPLVPQLHDRIINAEFDRELESTLVHPRFVWTENERLATLAAAWVNDKSKCSMPVLPWTKSTLAAATVQALLAEGWFDQDEPGPSSREFFDRFLESCLIDLRETPELREFASTCARTFSDLKDRVHVAKTQAALPASRSQVAVTKLNLSVVEILPASSPPTADKSTGDLAAIFDGNELLKVVSDKTWLLHARTWDPAIRLGSNLFFQQNLPGFERLRPETRVSIALLDAETRDEIAWCHIVQLAAPPDGRLRIRGVTTRHDLTRRGHATELLTLVSQALRTRPPRGFFSVDVYAAPEVLQAFRRASFEDDLTRMSRAEEAVDPASGNLIATERELVPLTLTLAPALGNT